MASFPASDACCTLLFQIQISLFAIFKFVNILGLALVLQEFLSIRKLLYKDDLKKKNPSVNGMFLVAGGDVTITA